MPQLPFLAWEPVTASLHLQRLEDLLRRRLARVEALRWLHLSGRGDRLRVVARLAHGRLAAYVAVEVSEVRLLARRLGFRLEGVWIGPGVRLPRTVVWRALGRAAEHGVRVLPRERIVIVDLGPWWPEGLDLVVRGVAVEDGRLLVRLGGGALSDPPL